MYPPDLHIIDLTILLLLFLYVRLNETPHNGTKMKPIDTIRAADRLGTSFVLPLNTIRFLSNKLSRIMTDFRL